jgi:hypothetical protein
MEGRQRHQITRILKKELRKYNNFERERRRVALS